MFSLCIFPFPSPIMSGLCVFTSGETWGLDFQAFVPDKPTRRGEFEVTCIFQTKEICSPRSSKDVILLLGSTLAMFDLGRCIFAKSISRNALWDLLMWSNDGKGLQRSWCLLRCLVSARALSECVTDTSRLPEVDFLSALQHRGSKFK